MGPWWSSSTGTESSSSDRVGTLTLHYTYYVHCVRRILTESCTNSVNYHLRADPTSDLIHPGPEKKDDFDMDDTYVSGYGSNLWIEVILCDENEIVSLHTYSLITQSGGYKLLLYTHTIHISLSLLSRPFFRFRSVPL